MPNWPKMVLCNHFKKLTTTEKNSPAEWMEGYSEKRELDFHFIARFFALRKWGGIRGVGSAGLAWIFCWTRNFLSDLARLYGRFRL